jgi:hypothetical protein
VTEEELAMMQKYKIDDDDGKIDRAEYMLLCAVRIGALDLSLLAAMNERFDKLDSDKSGALDYRELLEQVRESNAKKLGRRVRGRRTRMMRTRSRPAPNCRRSRRQRMLDYRQPVAMAMAMAVAMALRWCAACR